MISWSNSWSWNTGEAKKVGTSQYGFSSFRDFSIIDA